MIKKYIYLKSFKIRLSQLPKFFSFLQYSYITGHLTDWVRTSKQAWVYFPDHCRWVSLNEWCPNNRVFGDVTNSVKKLVQLENKPKCPIIIYQVWKSFFCDFDLWPSAKAKGGKLREEIICLDFVDVFPSHILIFPDNIFEYEERTRLWQKIIL